MDDDSDSDILTEQERERREYLAALHASTKAQVGRKSFR